ncbi:hypothetical protein SGLAD_v1c04510 [Spiroplasma gladiatoris]|uniref:Uncharacterized protein n=1 Tax=Spiroplasma gladiatoris TaxID=2143 RepID=A0A4P7AJE5_9MOLU|nr:hypothetical protein SGLAD_v1c04510 [Spiroplasma gladiatoris]
MSAFILLASPSYSFIDNINKKYDYKDNEYNSKSELESKNKLDNFYQRAYKL